MNRCKRCGQLLHSDVAILGPDCASLAREEANAFTQMIDGQTLEEWFEELDVQYAQDECLTVTEYIASFGRCVDDINFVVETLMNHGLWRTKKRPPRGKH